MTFNLPKTPAIQRVISSLPPRAVKGKMPENLTSQSRTTNPVRTFGQNTLGSSFARLSTPHPQFNLDNLAATPMPVGLTPVSSAGHIIGLPTSDPAKYAQITNESQQLGVTKQIIELQNPFGIPLSSMG